MHVDEMTGRERLLAVFRGETPDRVPFAPLIDGYFLASLPRGTTAVEALKLVGADVLERHVPTYTSGVGRSASLIAALVADPNPESVYAQTLGDTRIESRRRDGEVTRTVTTPIGVLTERFVFNEASPYIPFPVEFKIKTVEDLKVFRHVVSRNEFAPCYDLFVEEDARIGDDGMATASAPCTPLQTLIELEVGIENFYYLLHDHLSEVEETLELMHERNKDVYRIIAASPAQVVINYENSSTTLFSPSLYARYCLKQIDEYADVVHASGKVYLTHMCGKLKGLEPQLRAGRMDGIVDIAPPPTGDVDLADAKRMWGPAKVVAGGIDATAFTSFAPHEMRAYVRDLLTRLAPLDRVIVGSGDATPKTARLENLRAAGEAVRQYGALRG